jgi:hypothetical protein
MARSKPKITEKPDNIACENPSWAFCRCDAGGTWAIIQGRLHTVFWDKLYPRLQAFEMVTWADIEGNGSHFVNVLSLNKCAQDRLKELKIFEDEIFSLRIDGTKRLYGLRPKGALVLLWYDDNHGDNDTCVCRSEQKHT